MPLLHQIPPRFYVEDAFRNALTSAPLHNHTSRMKCKKELSCANPSAASVLDSLNRSAGSHKAKEFLNTCIEAIVKYFFVMKLIVTNSLVKNMTGCEQ